MRKYVALVPVIAILFTACSLLNEQNEGQAEVNSPVPAAMKVNAPFQPEELKQGAYIGGSLVYSPDRAVNQMVPGMFIRLVQKKNDENRGSSFIFGYLFIRAIDTNSITFDQVLFQSNGQPLSSVPNIILTNGQALSVDGDTIQDLVYIDARSDSNARAGFENAMHLKFRSDDETGCQTMFMVLPEELASGGFPSGVAVVNQSGRLTLELKLPEPDSSGNTSLPAGSVPELKPQDVVVDLNTGKNYLVDEYSKSFNGSVGLKLSPAGEVVPFDDIYINIEGDTDSLARQYSPEQYSKMNGPDRVSKTKKIFSKDYSLDFIDNDYLSAGLFGNITMSIYIKTKIGYSYSFKLWKPRLKFTVNCNMETKLITDAEVGFRTVFKASYNYPFKMTLGSLTTTIPVGYIIIQIGGSLSAGVDISASVKAQFKTSYQIHTEFGANVTMHAGTSSGVDVKPIHVIQFNRNPYEITLEGSASVKPYVLGDIWASVQGITMGVKAKPYIDAGVEGKITYSPTVKAGYLKYRMIPGITIDAYCGFGFSLPVIGSIRRTWNLGRIADIKFKEFVGDWNASLVPVSSLNMPTGLTVKEDDTKSGLAVTWAPVNLAAGYIVDKVVNGTNVGTFKTTMPEYLDKNSISWHNTYSYRIKAYNQDVYSPGNTTAEVVPAQPPTPSALTAVPEANGNIRLVFQEVKYAQKYHIVRKDIADDTSVNFTTTESHYDDSTAKPLHSYQYYVSTVKWTGEGEPAESAVVQPLLPGIVSGYAYSDYSMTWLPVTGATGYQVHRSLTDGRDPKDFTVKEAVLNDPEANPYSIYIYTIKALNLIGSGEASSFTAHTPAPAIKGFAYTRDQLVYTLTWAQQSGVIGYSVRRSLSDGTDIKDFELTTPLLKDFLPKLGKKYMYRITPKTSTGNGVSTTFDLNTPASIISPYVTGVYILYGRNVLPPAGYTKIGIDLNKGAGGDFIYLCYTKDYAAGLPINGLQVYSGGNRGHTNPAGYLNTPNTLSPSGATDGDLNRNSGGDFIFLHYSRTAENPMTGGLMLPLSDVGIILGSKSNTPAGWNIINHDLNRNCGGSFIYVVYKVAAGLMKTN